MKLLQRLLVFTLSVALIGAGSAFAQVETGQITGSVTDPTGAVVPGATVTVTNLGTNAQRTTQSSSSGSFQVGSLAPARFQVKVTSASFQPFTAQVEVTVGGALTVDARLSVSSNTTEVQVVGEGGVQVNTQSQELSQVVDRQQIQQLPSLTRNPYDFVAISGNISGGDNSASGASQNATLRGVNFSINGQRSTGTEILLDGVENISVFGEGVGINVPLDAVQEYRVLTSNFEPQYGRASGGVVNVTTLAGTNAFHGRVWEFNRLAAYTSNTVTNSQEGVPKGQYTRNQFGFVVGGPILKDKLFFTGSTEWIRVRSAAVSTSAVPTPQYLAIAPANIQAYFNAYGTNTFNLNNTYTAADLGIAGIPATTPVLGTTTFIAPGNAGGGLPQNTWNILGRFDYNLSDKTQVFFRYVNYNEADQPGSAFASPYAQYNVAQTVQNQAYLLSASHVFNPSLLSNTKLSFSRFNTFQSYDTALQNTPNLFVSPNAQVPGTSFFIQFPGFYDTNPASNGGLPFGGPQNTVQVNEDLQWIKGKHSTQFGTQIFYIQDNEAYGAYAQASEQLGQSRSLGLGNLATGNLFEFQAAVNPNGALPCVADPYTGDLTQTPGCSIALPAASPSFARSDRFHDWAVYGQDAFKVTPRFTLNYGVRYEYYGVQHNNHADLDSNFYYGDGRLDPEGIRTGQVYTVPNSPIHSLWSPSYGTVSPRVGFAYDIFGNGRTSFRGGYGISYERNFGNVTFNVIQNPPNYAVIVVNNTPATTSNLGPLGGGTGSVPLPPTSLRNVDQNIKTAQTQFYSAALEHQIVRNTVLSIEFAGARGLHLYDIKNINGLGSGNALLGDSLLDPTGTIPGLTRLNSQYSNTNNRGSGADSYYDALNIQFQTTDIHHTGLNVTANYTYAHALDDLSTTFSETNNEFSLGYTNPFNPAFDRGNSDLDIRHRFVLAPIYRTPWSNPGHAAWKQAVFGWQVTGIYTVRTGTPFSYYDTTYNQTGYNVARYTPATGVIPQHTFKSLPSGADGGGTNTYTVGNLPAAVSYYNQDWYTATNTPAVIAAGNTPIMSSDWALPPAAATSRNAFRGPGAWNFDAAVSKTIPIHEQLQAVFRAEGFDLLNHHNLYLQEGLNDVFNVGDGVPVPVIASKGGIGANGGVNDERRFGQFSLSLQF